MKLHIYALMMFGLLSVVSVGYAQAADDSTSMEEVKKETQDLLHTIGSYSVEKKDEAVQKAKDGLNKVDERIDALEAKIDKSWDKMNKDARKEARENLKALHKHREQVSEWYDNMKMSTADAWDNMKKGFSGAYKDLENAWEKSEKEFGDSK